MSNEIEIGRGKRAQKAYSLDDVAIVPNRRTRDPKDVSVSWQIDAFQFDTPILGAPMDSVTSPATAIALGKLGGLGVLNLEGLWTRYENPEAVLAEIAGLKSEAATRNDPKITAKLQELYSAPIQPELITSRISEIRDSGVVVAGSLTPQRTQEHYKTVVAAGVDIFVIRGTTVSAEHVSKTTEPLNLKQFIYELDVPVIVGGAAGYTPAMHLMRTGAAGVLVGFGGGASSTTRRTLGIHAPMATAIADVAAARRDYIEESGGRYVHVIADGGMGNSGDIVKAIAMGADAVMLGTALARAEEAPGAGYHWGMEAVHEASPRGDRAKVGTVGSLEKVLYGPSHETNGTSNLVGALRRSMATTGYSTLKEFQRVDVVLSPYESDRY
ncbi:MULTISPECIES: GuaB3 family IMP dehydrogenase-related protein [Glutamicibacter]|uniref:GuaB3 family IMP dehydrogenase-related protein n=1 Tax=Glutamicibacter halophytocola TaxID=1933880 RepID=A0A5B8IHS7_9MICC|nr:GuaB3 family IMP dehydrogenase-related protein [Glutamicibacter halophytocola]MBF6672821.1 GuaB3 family IMP dehydrogenase-related protein [Glutamicibacter sp. FBE19]ALG29574.1 inosine-5-monophosphate dehydrogenase [Glutamicibacter halophytocola]NQD41325.1 GuaB3 family IMP dehydrogenase-related protein [Glutamicibacter halophytocola]QDY65822.1 GuaB3 family IMP dehydrogenase-related protein [Glutamicibacter halophytocola]UUX57917.1 GuaB3 family IMP dehydrogenase-related protein [Glutamicibact